MMISRHLFALCKLATVCLFGLSMSANASVLTYEFEGTLNGGSTFDLDFSIESTTGVIQSYDGSITGYGAFTSLVGPTSHPSYWINQFIVTGGERLHVYVNRTYINPTYA